MRTRGEGSENPKCLRTSLMEAPLQDDHNAVYKLATSDSDRALNTAELSKCAQRPATEVAEEMRKLILRNSI